MRYLCTNCNYIYDEGLGDREEYISSGTVIYDIENFSCPVCDSPSELFQEIKEEVNYIDDDNIFSMEEEHYLNYEIIEDENSLFGEVLKVSVGKDDLHSMGEDHFIKSISLYSDEELIEEKFLKDLDVAIVEFDYDSLGEFEIRVDCSLHGVWGRKIIL